MDFYKTRVQPIIRSSGDYVVSADFMYNNSKDIICRGAHFHAYYDPTSGLWVQDKLELAKVIDKDIEEAAKRLEQQKPDAVISKRLMLFHSSKLMEEFAKFCKHLPTKDVVFNTKVLFKSDKPKRTDYATAKLSYDPTDMPTPAFDEVMDTLYSPEEQAKILWFMGLILTGQSSKVHKFMYLYGGKGTGKGTVIKIFRNMLEEYVDDIDLQVLTSNDPFATGQVKEVPLLIDEDTDISRIKKDTNLLKLTAHEPMPINRKYASEYTGKFSGTLITASNQRYQVRNVDSGITRRAIVISPKGKQIPRKRYDELMSLLKFEYPGIAKKAIDHVNEVGLRVYEDVMDVEMAEATDLIFSFIRENEAHFGDMITLAQASALYKEFLEDLGFETKGYKRRIKIELQRYYDVFYKKKKIDGMTLDNVYVGFKTDLVFPERKLEIQQEESNALDLQVQPSVLDEIMISYPAQLANEEGIPTYTWLKCKTILADIDTRKLHFVRVPANHIVLDFDLKDAEGNKSLELNLEAASQYPETYAEVSKSGNGIHLHYYYDGPVEKLANEVSEHIEIKVFSGKSSLRRKLTMCNNKPMAHLSTGLPFKEESEMNKHTEEIIWSEKKIRTAIEKNLRKEYHSATKPSIDFIAHILKQAYDDGIKYDLRDMRQEVMSFAMNSTNHVQYCLGVVYNMKFNSIEEDDFYEMQIKTEIVPDEELWFYDIEIFPNLLIVAFKKYGSTDRTVWFNPTPQQLEQLMKRPLIGFNNRGYDNHLIYSAMLGASNIKLYHQSKEIVESGRGGAGKLGPAYEISYADIYEYNSTKQGLKKWEIELGIKHDELEFPWDQPLPEEQWERAGEYCANDVDATEALFKATYYDYKARLILASLTGLSVNATTQQHAAQWLFGNDKRPQDKFVYTDLATIFPGYKYEFGKSTYMDEDPSEGGLVRHKPGVWKDVELFDVASMHPHAAKALNYFGPYQDRFNQLIDARIAVKHHDFELAATYFDGALKPYLTEADADDLAFALKIIINIVYGMTSAKFDNKFRHPDNVDNIVAKYGALFMITLKNELEKMGVEWVHIKTDSIKVVKPTEEVKKFIFDFGKKYGFDFEHEATYEIMALVNKAVYIAKYGWADKASKIGKWEAVGTQFQVPYVFKTLFSNEELKIEDYAMTKSATAPIYIGDTYIGKTANVYASLTGEEMYRVADDKRGAVTGTKGYKWKLWSPDIDKDDIDMSYYEGLNLAALKAIDKVGGAYQMFENQEPPARYADQLLPF